jgi:hypothetical protein
MKTSITHRSAVTSRMKRSPAARASCRRMETNAARSAGPSWRGQGGCATPPESLRGGGGSSQCTKRPSAWDGKSSLVLGASSDALGAGLGFLGATSACLRGDSAGSRSSLAVPATNDRRRRPNLDVRPSDLDDNRIELARPPKNLPALGRNDEGRDDEAPVRLEEPRVQWEEPSWSLFERTVLGARNRSAFRAPRSSRVTNRPISDVPIQDAEISARRRSP